MDLLSDGAVSVAVWRGRSIRGGTGDPDRFYGYVHSGASDHRHRICEDKIYHRCLIAGTDHLSDRGGSDHHQERDPSEFMETVFDLYGANVDRHSDHRAVCQSCVVKSRNL